MRGIIRNRRPTPLPKSYQGLARLMPPRVLRDDVQHEQSVAMVDRLMRVPRLSREQADYLETLVELVEAYERKHHAIDTSGLNGARMLQHVLRESGTSASALSRLLGLHPTMGSKILRGQRRLTWEHAKTLAEHFSVAPVLFMD